MKTIKAILNYLFADQWYYNLDYSMRIHKETGDVQYRHMDGWGNYWEDEPMFEEEYSYVPRKGCHLKVVSLRGVQ
jgi:hypothetical protein